MNERTCCFTGHRKIPEEQEKQLAKTLRKTVIELIENGVIYFGAGGALGFDTMAAQTILSLKNDYPQIRLILVLPCRGQTKGWPEKDFRLYRDILLQSDKVVYTSIQYSSDCMRIRDRHLVDHSSICVCYLTEKSGGTAYTVRYVRKQGLNIINLAPFILQSDS